MFTKATSLKRFPSPKVIALLLGLLTIAIYLPALRNGFVNYDDQDYVTANEQVKSGLTFSGIKWAFTEAHASNWHPLTWLSHMLDCQLFGLNPVGHHLTNVLLHSIATVLLFFLIHQMTRALFASAFVAALFAFHPMHVESVAWVAERKDVLSASLGFASLLFYARYAETFQSNGLEARRKWDYAFALVCLALGLLAKPMLVTFPFVMLLLDVWPLKRLEKFGKLTIKQVLVEKIPFFALAVVSSYITFVVQHKAGAVRALKTIPIDFRIFNSLIAYFRYIGKLFWPLDLAAFYPLPDYLSAWMGLAAAAGLIGISILVFLRRIRWPFVFTGWFWFVGTLVPVIGLVQVGGQSMADRYSYIPSVGLFIVIAWSLAKLKNTQFRRFALPVGGGLILLLCGAATLRQITYWHDSASLFEHALAVTQGNYVAYANLASARVQNGHAEAAIGLYEKALEIEPETFEGNFGIAVAHSNLGHAEQAVRYCQAAIALQPENAVAQGSLGNMLSVAGRLPEAIAAHRKAVELDPEYAEGHFNFAVVLEKHGDLEEALAQYRDFERLRPKAVEAPNAIGRLLEMQQRFDEAAEQYRRALTLDPGNAAAWRNLGDLAMKRGKIDEAVSDFRRAVEINPGLAEAHYNLGIIFADQKKVEDAVAQYLEALRIKPDYSDAHNNFAVLLAGRGDFTNAALHLVEVVRLQPDSAEAHFNLSYVLAKLGRTEDSKAEYTAAVKLNPGLANRK